MKKYIICLLFVLSLNQICFSQDFDQLMNECANNEKAERKTVDFKATMAELETYQPEISSELPLFVHNIDSLDVIMLDNCRQEIKTKFIKEFSKYKDGNGYETLFKFQDEEEGGGIYTIAQKENNTIKRIFITIIKDDEDSADNSIMMLKVTGNFNEDADLRKIIKDQGIMSIYSFLYLFNLSQTCFSQSFDELMDEYAKYENAKRETVDFKTSMTELKTQYPDINADLPSFINNIDSVDVVTLNNCSQEIKSKFEKELNDFKDGDCYETLVIMKDDNETARVLKRKGEEIATQLLIFSIDNEDTVLGKMYGTFKASDIEEFINQQKKNLSE